MWLIFFLVFQAAAGATLDFEVFKTKIEPLLLEKRPGHARCYVCHSTGTTFRLQLLSPGAATWNEEQSQKNFDMVQRFVLRGVPLKSRLLTMPLAADAGGVAFHPAASTDVPGRRRVESAAAWVNGRP
jgi:hypothetical protein